jgi:hypothetical protein
MLLLYVLPLLVLPEHPAELLFGMLMGRLCVYDWIRDGLYVGVLRVSLMKEWKGGDVRREGGFICFHRKAVTQSRQTHTSLGECSFRLDESHNARELVR